jgi:hypothetical protein
MNITDATCRAGLERLMEEFASAYSDETSIRHQRLSGLRDQSLTKEAWEDLRIANRPLFERRKKDEWEKWVPHPDGLVCSRFVGVGDKRVFELFQQLANTGMALLREASLSPESTLSLDSRIADKIESPPTIEAYLYWLELMHLTAKECRTHLLHVDVGNWNHKANPFESVELVAKAMSEPTPFGMGAFPLHPIVEDLQHDVFRSSVEAIKVWLGATDVVRVGKWADRPPFYFPLHKNESSEPSGGIVSTPQVAQPEEIDEESSPPAPTKLVIDDKTTVVSFGGVSEQWGDTVPYRLLKSLHRHRQFGATIDDLKQDAWEQSEAPEDASVIRQISKLRERLKDYKYKGIIIDGKTVMGRYKLVLTTPTNSE